LTTAKSQNRAEIAASYPSDGHVHRITEGGHQVAAMLSWKPSDAYGGRIPPLAVEVEPSLESVFPVAYRPRIGATMRRRGAN